MLPDATFINQITRDGCVSESPQRVNEHYARSRVGLCLSKEEGTMRVSAEYLLAGLPLVSTRSKGGRDFFFDSDYCLVVDDDPHPVAEAVGTLVKRNIPRHYVRERTLEKIHRERERFAKIVDGLISPDDHQSSSLERIEQLAANNAIQSWRELKPLIRQLEQAL